MTTVTFSEDIKLPQNNQEISVVDFLGILEENGLFPVFHELPQSDITPEIQEAFEASKLSTDRINL